MLLRSNIFRIETSMDSVRDSESIESSRVIRAQDIQSEQERISLRFSLGKQQKQTSFIQLNRSSNIQMIHKFNRNRKV